MRILLAAALQALGTSGEPTLEERLAALRAVAASVHQRHQSERNPVRYALRYIADTIWPPHRAVFMVRAWSEAPRRAEALVRRHRPGARFVLMGHTHRPGVWRTGTGPVIVNTGTFCPPFGSLAVDLTPGQLKVRRIERQGGEFRAGATVAEFSL